MLVQHLTTILTDLTRISGDSIVKSTLWTRPLLLLLDRDILSDSKLIWILVITISFLHDLHFILLLLLLLLLHLAECRREIIDHVPEVVAKCSAHLNHSSAEFEDIGFRCKFVSISDLQGVGQFIKTLQMEFEFALLELEDFLLALRGKVSEIRQWESIKQKSSGIDNSFQGSFKEFAAFFDVERTTDFSELSENDWFLGCCFLHGFTVFPIASRVEVVFGEVEFRLLLVWVLLSNEDVALVEAACIGVMFSPFTETQPAELLTATVAGHMHAAIVLLDWNATTWTWASFSIELDPFLGDVFIFTINKIVPLGSQLAREWLMGDFVALDAEHSTAWTGYCTAAFVFTDFARFGEFGCVFDTNDLRAFGVWTPFQVVCIINIVSENIGAVFFVFLLREEFTETRLQK